jgi:hypothetical protein
MANPAEISALPFLGRRVERLIFSGVLLVLLCFIETFLATANRQISENRSADVLRGLIEQIAKDESRLSELFQAGELPSKARLIQEVDAEDAKNNTRILLGLPPALPKKTEELQEPQTYRAALTKIISDVVASARGRSTDYELNKYANFKISPAELQRKLQEQLQAIENTPTNVWGILTPSHFQLEYAGREYQFPFSFVSEVLEIILAPLIVGWLGAIYATRQRELLLIAKLENYKLAFPYILNFLPVQFTFSQQKNITHPWLLSFHLKLLASFRSLVLLVLSTPMLIGFSYSIRELSSVDPDGVPIAYWIGGVLSLIMMIQILILVLQEWLILKDKYFYEQ